MKSKFLSILLCSVGVLLTLYFTNVFLTQNFQDDGESYMKGFGHLLQENITKGILFVIIQNLLLCYFISMCIFLQVPPNNRKNAHKILFATAATILFVTISYTIYQLYNVYSNGYDRIDRIIEIALTWTSRVLGLYLGYWLSNYKTKLPKA